MASLDVSALTSEQYGVIRSFLLRVLELSPEARWSLAVKLANATALELRLTPPPGVGPELFLACVAAAYQRRHGPAAAGPPVPAAADGGPPAGPAPVPTRPGPRRRYPDPAWAATAAVAPRLGRRPAADPACGPAAAHPGSHRAGSPPAAFPWDRPADPPAAPRDGIRPPAPPAAARVAGSTRYPFGMAAYLDHAASTPTRPEVVDAMLPFLRDRHANPSGAHRLAREARRAARRRPRRAGRGARGRAGRGGVHQRGHRVRQPGRAGQPRPLRLAWPCARRSSTTPCSTRCVARTGLHRAGRRPRGRSISTRWRPPWSTPRAGPGGHGGLGHAGQQRGRHRPAPRRGGRAGAPPCPGRGAAHRRRAGPALAGRGRGRRPAPTWSRSAATSSGDPRGSGPWWCGAGPSWPPARWAAVRSATGAAAPPTWPASSGMAVAARLATDERAATVERVGKLARPPGRRAGRVGSRAWCDRRGRRPGDRSTGRVERRRRGSPGICHVCIARDRERGPPLPARAATRCSPRPARRVPAGPWNRPTCWPPWACPGTWPRGRCGCRWGGPAPTPTSTLALDGRSGRGRARLARFAPSGRRVDRPDEAAGGHVGRRGLVGGRGAAGRRRPRRHRRDHEAVGRRQRHRVLLGGRRRRRPPGRPAPGHRPPGVQLRRRLHGPGGRPLRGRPRRGAHAQPVHRVQPPPQVRPAARAGPRRSASTGWPPATTPGWSPTRPAAAGWPAGPTRPRTRATCCTWSSPSWLDRVWLPGRRPDQGRGAGRGGPAGAAHRHQARQPGRVLHHRLGRPAGLPRPRIALHPGRVVDGDGRQVGQVDAVELVTVGQRRGLGLAGEDAGALRGRGGRGRPPGARGSGRRPRGGTRR